MRNEIRRLGFRTTLREKYQKGENVVEINAIFALSPSADRADIYSRCEMTYTSSLDSAKGVVKNEKAMRLTKFRTLAALLSALTILAEKSSAEPVTIETLPADTQVISEPIKIEEPPATSPIALPNPCLDNCSKLPDLADLTLEEQQIIHRMADEPGELKGFLIPSSGFSPGFRAWISVFGGGRVIERIGGGNNEPPTDLAASPGVDVEEMPIVPASDGDMPPSATPVPTDNPSSPQPKACAKHDKGLRLTPIDGTSLRLLEKPHGIAVHPALGVVIPDMSTPEELLFINDDDTGPKISLKAKISGVGEAKTNPRAVTVDSDKTSYVTFSMDGFIRTFDPSGRRLSDLWVAKTVNPVDISIFERTLAVADATSAIFVGKKDGTGDGQKFKEVTINGMRSKLYGPHGLRYDSGGNLWIADTFNARILRIEAQALAKGGDAPAATEFLLSTFNRKLKPARGFDEEEGPYGIAFDQFGDLYVSIYRHNVIDRFSYANNKISLVEKITDNLGPDPRHLTTRGCDLYVVDGQSSYIVYRVKG